MASMPSDSASSSGTPADGGSPKSTKSGGRIACTRSKRPRLLSEDTTATSSTASGLAEAPSHHETSWDESEVKYTLDPVENPYKISCDPGWQNIHSETLKDLLSPEKEAEFEQLYYLVDCRYPFEYDGGHIKHAQNHWNRDEIKDLFDIVTSRNLIPIFYCELSEIRGPGMAREFRKYDRNQGGGLRVPEMYVLDRGYRKFFKKSNSRKNLCEPKGYARMKDPAHKEELAKYTYHKEKKQKPKEAVRRRSNARQIPLRLSPESESESASTSAQAPAIAMKSKTSSTPASASTSTSAPGYETDSEYESAYDDTTEVTTDASDEERNRSKSTRYEIAPNLQS